MASYNMLKSSAVRLNGMRIAIGTTLGEEVIDVLAYSKVNILSRIN